MCKSKLKLSYSATYRALFVVLLLGIVSGCAVKFVYNQLDWAIPWYLSDYMSLDGDQEDAFDEQLERYLTWHRKTQLPLYSAFLRDIAKELERGMSEESISFVREKTNELGHALVERLAPDMVQLFYGASDKQITQLFDKFDEENAEYTEDYIEASERTQRKLRAKEIQAYIERWTGDLTKNQEAIIREGTDQYQLMGREFLDAKLAWQDEFKRVLALRETPDVYSEALTALLLSEGFGQSDSFREKLAHNEIVLRALYLKLDKSLSDKQRKKAVKTLRGYAQDFIDLSQSG